MILLFLPGKYFSSRRGPEAVSLDDTEIRLMVRDIELHNQKELTPDEFEDLVSLISSFWQDVEKEAERVSKAEKEIIISYFNGVLASLSGAFMRKYRMDTSHAHSRAGDEVISTALNLIYEKGLIKEFIVRFEAIPLRKGVYKEYLTEKAHLKEQLIRKSGK
jgi:hypothetical protein